MRNKKMITLSMGLALSFGFLVACSNSSSAPDQSKSSEVKVDTTPVKITISAGWNISEADFQQIFVKPVAKKYPYIKQAPEERTLVSSSIWML